MLGSSSKSSDSSLVLIIRSLEIHFFVCVCKIALFTALTMNGAN